MKYFYILLLFALLSCTKESSNDFRDIYVGEYKGTYTCNVPEISEYSNTRTICASVVKGNEGTQLLINNLGINYFAIAYLDNNRYTYSPFEIATNSAGVTTAIKFTGTGYFDGKKMRDMGNIEVYENGKEYTGTWETNLTKL